MLHSVVYVCMSKLIVNNPDSFSQHREAISQDRDEAMLMEVTIDYKLHIPFHAIGKTTSVYCLCLCLNVLCFYIVISGCPVIIRTRYLLLILKDINASYLHW